MKRYLCVQNESSTYCEGATQKDAAWNAAQELFGERNSISRIEQEPSGWWQTYGKPRTSSRDDKEIAVGRRFKIVDRR